MNDRCDYAIVGAGPAGLAVAILAASAGRRAVVVERRPGPLDQACGEGLMPPGVAWLARLGVTIAPEDCRPFRGVRYVDGDLVAQAGFAEGPGLGVRRTALSRALLSRAGALGAEVRLGCAAGAVVTRDDHVLLETASGPIEARWLVGADGRHSQVRGACGFAVRAAAHPRFGIRRHFRLAPWSDFVEVHWADGVEAYVTPVAPECVGIAFLWSAVSGAAGDYDAFMERFPALRARLGPAADRPESAVRGGGPFGASVREAARGRVLLVGDAAGSLDAITGEGLSLAFASAAALVEATRGADAAAGGGAAGGAAAGGAAAYARVWPLLRRRQVALSRLVLRLAEHPALRRRVVAALRDAPEGFGAFLGLTTGAWGWGRALPGLARLGLRLATPRATTVTRQASST
jgi:2-polyprenyl-6-methoxyphenol hydroxylase-like FAD-dependent oxidoreductase